MLPKTHPTFLNFNNYASCGTTAQESEKDMEQLDEDFAVTQSQVTFTCPLTQVFLVCFNPCSYSDTFFPVLTSTLLYVKVDMVKPVKNLKCNHHYEEAAILGMIKTRRGQKKKCQ